MLREWQTCGVVEAAVTERLRLARILVAAEAGTQFLPSNQAFVATLDSRFRGNERN
jgi:hypothetical protein